MTISQAIGERILSLCKTRNITVNHLADMSGVWQSTLSEMPQTTVDAVVRGVTSNPRLKTIYKIALGFGMTLSEFLDFPEMNEVEFDDFN